MPEQRVVLVVGEQPGKTEFGKAWTCSRCLIVGFYARSLHTPAVCERERERLNRVA